MDSRTGKLKNKKFILDYPPEFNEEFKRYIRKRDRMVCSNCHRRARLDVHHIDYNRYNTVRSNCISLCRECHRVIHHCTWIEKHRWKYILWQLAAERERKRGKSR